LKYHEGWVCARGGGLNACGDGRDLEYEDDEFGSVDMDIIGVGRSADLESLAEMVAEDTIDEEAHLMVDCTGAVVTGVASGCAEGVSCHDVADGYFPWVGRV